MLLILLRIRAVELVITLECRKIHCLTRERFVGFLTNKSIKGSGGNRVIINR